MTESRGETACKLGIAAIVGAVVAIVAGAPRWVFDEKGAAWAQVVGAIVALAVTILLNRVDARERKLERDARARAAGVFVRPILAEFSIELGEALRSLDSGSSAHASGPYDDEGFTWGIAGIDSPPIRLRDRLQPIAELGHAAKVTQVAYQSMGRLHAAFVAHYIEEIGECSYDDADQLGRTIALMRRCKRETDEALRQIDSLYE